MFGYAHGKVTRRGPTMPDGLAVMEFVRCYGLPFVGLFVFAVVGAGWSTLLNDPALQRGDLGK